MTGKPIFDWPVKPLNEGEQNFLLLHDLYVAGADGWKLKVLRRGSRFSDVAQPIITLDREQSFEHWCMIIKMYA